MATLIEYPGLFPGAFLSEKIGSNFSGFFPVTSSDFPISTTACLLFVTTSNAFETGSNGEVSQALFFNTGSGGLSSPRAIGGVGEWHVAGAIPLSASGQIPDGHTFYISGSKRVRVDLGAGNVTASLDEPWGEGHMIQINLDNTSGGELVLSGTEAWDGTNSYITLSNEGTYVWLRADEYYEGNTRKFRYNLWNNLGGSLS